MVVVVTRNMVSSTDSKSFGRVPRSIYGKKRTVLDLVSDMYTIITCLEKVFLLYATYTFLCVLLLTA